MNYFSVKELFSQNLEFKLLDVIKEIDSLDSKKQLFLPFTWKAILLNNPNLISAIKNSSLTIAFYEQSQDAKYQIHINSYYFLVTSETKLFREQFEFIKKFSQECPDNVKFHLLIYPAKNYQNKIYMEENLIPKLQKILNNVIEVNFDFFYVENNFYIMNYEGALKEIFNQREFIHLDLIAENLHKLQIIFGKFKEIISLGEAANHIVERVKILDKNNKNDLDDHNVYYEGCFIFDRMQDLYTPLMMQFSYQGLLDEIFKMKFNTIDEKHLSGKNDIYLLSKDKDMIYSQYKHMHLANFMKQVQTNIQELRTIKNQEQNFSNIEQSKLIAEKIQNKPFLELHLKLAKQIDAHLKDPIIFEKIRLSQMSLIEPNNAYSIIDQFLEIIQIEAPLEQTINLLILMNLVFKGFTPYYHKKIQYQFTQIYGMKGVRILAQLNKDGLFVLNNNTKENNTIINISNFEQISKEMNLINPQTNVFSDQDLYNTFSGYYPLSLKYIELLLTKDKDISKIPFKNGSIDNFREISNFVIFFTGGISLGEVQLLQKVFEKMKKNVLIGSPTILSSQSLSHIYMNQFIKQNIVKLNLENFLRVFQNFTLVIPSPFFYWLILKFHVIFIQINRVKIFFLIILFSFLNVMFSILWCHLNEIFQLFQSLFCVHQFLLKFQMSFFKLE